MGTDVTTIFNNFQEYLNSEQTIRESIRLVVKELDRISREIVTILQGIHQENTKEVHNICVKAKTILKQVKQYNNQLAGLVPKDQYYRFHDQWKFVTQRLVFSLSLIVFLESKTLVERETVANMLGLKVGRQDGFHLDIEDYLMGLLNLASELSRYAVNSVTYGDYEKPLEISRFVGELNAGFRLLNLRNDSLRKRYDGLKYDVKKIEEVVYDLSLRGLTNKSGIGESTQAASTHQQSSKSKKN